MRKRRFPGSDPPPAEETLHDLWQIPSLQEYLVCWQDEARVGYHRRTADNKWVLEEIAGREQSVRLETVGFHLSLRQAYAKVAFDP